MRYAKDINSVGAYRYSFLEKVIRLVFFLVLFLFSTLVTSQTSNNLDSTGPSAINTTVGGGQSNLLGTNIGSQQNATTVTGGYGNVNTNIPGKTTSEVISVPTMYAPGLTASGSDVCLGSISASGSILGLGLAGGKTYVDENCVLLKNSQRMAALGFGNAAVVMMLQNPDVERAIRTSSPSVYLQVAKDRLGNLQAEFEDAIEMGESTFELQEKLKIATKELRIIVRRVQNSPGLPEKAVEIPSIISNDKVLPKLDPRDTFNH
ncbi:hypothetical protein [Polynucleobacter kasalickyi]|uniref:Uncharacterized protein n=1 Tax=Polynucleobacter kasalickyi TaxID=1938817 RepID=A0A1W1Y9Z6_9BURK|nr:hypothetical protein [Polynucleobacter kasalickyi]SMC32934.1 hypothetical protein SAMN06296008_102150 [Polynucleobacter kasalickyi]